MSCRASLQDIYALDCGATFGMSWPRRIGQVVKVGSTERKDGPDDGQAEAVFG